MSTVCYDKTSLLGGVNLIWTILRTGGGCWAGLNSRWLLRNLTRLVGIRQVTALSDTPLQSYIQIIPSRSFRWSHLDFRHTYVSRDDDRNRIFNITVKATKFNLSLIRLLWLNRWTYMFYLRKFNKYILSLNAGQQRSSGRPLVCATNSNFDLIPRIKFTINDVALTDDVG